MWKTHETVICHAFAGIESMWIKKTQNSRFFPLNNNFKMLSTNSCRYQPIMLVNKKYKKK